MNTTKSEMIEKSKWQQIWVLWTLRYCVYWMWQRKDPFYTIFSCDVSLTLCSITCHVLHFFNAIRFWKKISSAVLNFMNFRIVIFDFDSFHHIKQFPYLKCFCKYVHTFRIRFMHWRKENKYIKTESLLSKIKSIYL